MKKALNLFLALSMVMVLSLGGAIQAFGESASPATVSQPTAPSALQPAETLRSEALTATPQQDTDPWPGTLESGSDAGDYVPNQALVMFRASDEPLTKGQAIRALSTGNHSISDFKDGTATFKVPYELKDGQSPRGIVVWYVSDDGERVRTGPETVGDSASLIALFPGLDGIRYVSVQACSVAQGAEDVLVLPARVLRQLKVIFVGVALFYRAFARAFLKNFVFVVADFNRYGVVVILLLGGIYGKNAQKHQKNTCESNRAAQRRFPFFSSLFFHLNLLPRFLGGSPLNSQ